MRLSVLLYAAIALLMVDSIIELSFISSMVAWLHNRAGGAFDVNYNGGTFSLHGKPKHLLVDQGHTSNGAAGTAFVLIGLGGILSLTLRNRIDKKHAGNGKGHGAIRFLHASWLCFTVLSVALTLAALIYTFVITNTHDGQVIDVALASTLHNRPYPNYVAYPLQEWTPENWFTAVLQLDLAHASDVSDIRLHLHVMRAWRWNLIPMFILGLLVAVLAFIEAAARRRNGHPQTFRVLSPRGKAEQA